MSYSAIMTFDRKQPRYLSLYPRYIKQLLETCYNNTSVFEQCDSQDRNVQRAGLTYMSKRTACIQTMKSRVLTALLYILHDAPAVGLGHTAQKPTHTLALPQPRTQLRSQRPIIKMGGDHNISTKVFACGHEAFVPIPKDKWDESYEKPVHYACKCDNCDFPKLLLRFRHFNNPSNRLCLSRTTRLAFEMFDGRHTLSVENMDALMRHWMRAIQCQLCDESKHKALFDCLAESVARQDGQLAGKQMRALLESGYLRFIKNGRGYSRPVSRRRPNIRIPTMASLSRPESVASSNEPSSSKSELPFSHLESTPISPVTSPLSDNSSRRDKLDGLDSRMTADEWLALEQEYADDEEKYDEEEAARLRAALERLHDAVEFLGWPAEDWGNHKAEAETIEKYCQDLERPPLTLAEKALHYRFIPKDKREKSASEDKEPFFEDQKKS